jgi:hypothetical protein
VNAGSAWLSQAAINAAGDPGPAAVVVLEDPVVQRSATGAGLPAAKSQIATYGRAGQESN